MAETGLFFEKLEMYTSAGLTLDQALELSKQANKKSQNAKIERILHAIRSGQTFSKALADNIRVSKIIIGLIAHGEASGARLETLEMVKKLIEKQEELRKKLISATIYPLVIGIFSSVLTIGLMRGVIPQIIPVLKNMKIDLPLITKFVIYLSENFVFVILISIIISILIFGLIRFVIIPRPRLLFLYQKLILHIPLVGTIETNHTYSIFFRSMGFMTRAGLSLAHAYRYSTDNLTILPIKESFEKFFGPISAGTSLSSAMANHRVDSVIPALIRAGEASGTLSQSLVRIADILDRDQDSRIKRLSAIIEPIMMIILGGIVTVVALSIMLPIYDVSKALQR